MTRRTCPGGVVRFEATTDRTAAYSRNASHGDWTVALLRNDRLVTEWHLYVTSEDEAEHLCRTWVERGVR